MLLQNLSNTWVHAEGRHEPAVRECESSARTWHPPYSVWDAAGSR